MSDAKYKQIICVDFDGVIHSYESGWKGADVIPDPPVDGAFGWLRNMLDQSDFRMCIYSSRSSQPGGIEAMKLWFSNCHFGDEWLAKLEFPTQKPAASMTIDDRAFCFEGDFPSAEWLRRFLPWNKRAAVAR